MQLSSANQPDAHKTPFKHDTGVLPPESCVADVDIDPSLLIGLKEDESIVKTDSRHVPEMDNEFDAQFLDELDQLEEKQLEEANMATEEKRETENEAIKKDRKTSSKRNNSFSDQESSKRMKASSVVEDKQLQEQQQVMFRQEELSRKLDLAMSILHQMQIEQQKYARYEQRFNRLRDVLVEHVAEFDGKLWALLKPVMQTTNMSPEMGFDDHKQKQALDDLIDK